VAIHLDCNRPLVSGFKPVQATARLGNWVWQNAFIADQLLTIPPAEEPILYVQVVVELVERRICDIVASDTVKCHTIVAEIHDLVDVLCAWSERQALQEVNRRPEI